MSGRYHSPVCRTGPPEPLFLRVYGEQKSIPPAYEAYAGIFKQSIRARNRVGILLSYRPARLHRLAEFIPWNRFLGSMNVLKIRAQKTKKGKLDYPKRMDRIEGT